MVTVDVAKVGVNVQAACCDTREGSAIDRDGVEPEQFLCPVLVGSTAGHYRQNITQHDRPRLWRVIVEKKGDGGMASVDERGAAHRESAPRRRGIGRPRAGGRE